MAISNYLQKTVKIYQVIKPQAEGAAGTTNSTAVDKRAALYAGIKYGEGLILLSTGAISGTPDATSVKVKLQHSDDNSAWSDVTDLAVVEAAEIEITAADTVKTLAFRPEGCKRYMRSVLTVAFTAGTTPKVFATVAMLYGIPHRV